MYKTKTPKVFICGPSGTGKTTLAKELSKAIDIPFVESSASTVWPQFGFTSHADVLMKISNNPELGFDYQMAILDNRIEVLKDLDFFITDRTPFDTMVYFMLQNSALVGRERCELYKQRCTDLALLTNTLIFLPFGNHIPLEDNGKRIQSEMFQYTTSSIFSKILKDNYIGSENYSILILNYWDFQTRLKDSLYFLRSPKLMSNRWTL